LLASALDDEDECRTYTHRYLAMAQALHFEGHLQTARAMTA
jgi:hypothetical protein